MPAPVLHTVMSERVPPWIQEVLRVTDTAGAYYTPRVYMDGVYIGRANGLHGVFDTKQLTLESGGGIVVMHGGSDWRQYPVIVVGRI